MISHRFKEAHRLASKHNLWASLNLWEITTHGDSRYMHLMAARKARVEKLSTLNEADFEHVHRTGDPLIEKPV